MPRKTLSPAQLVIRLFGGVRATARIVGRSPEAVSRWAKPASKGGAGGRIPSAMRKIILQAAEDHGIYITSHELDFGRDLKT